MSRKCAGCAESNAFGAPGSSACSACLAEQDQAAREAAEEKRGREEVAMDDEYARKRDERIGRAERGEFYGIRG